MRATSGRRGRKSCGCPWGWPSCDISGFSWKPKIASNSGPKRWGRGHGRYNHQCAHGWEQELAGRRGRAIRGPHAVNQLRHHQTTDTTNAGHDDVGRGPDAPTGDHSRHAHHHTSPTDPSSPCRQGTHAFLPSLSFPFTRHHRNQLLVLQATAPFPRLSTQPTTHSGTACPLPCCA